jgi:hypothetical protein
MTEIAPRAAPAQPTRGATSAHEASPGAAIARQNVLVGLTGPAGCGKDTVAAILQRRFGFARIAFADAIRDMLTVIGVNRADMQHPQRKNEPIEWLGHSPRRMLQTLGTEWARALDADLWVKILERKLRNHGGASGRRLVITDCRFENEAAWLRANGGSMWHIARPWTPALDGEAGSHASEAGVAWRPGDCSMSNVGTLEELEQYVVAVYEQTHRGAAR